MCISFHGKPEAIASRSHLRLRVGIICVREFPQLSYWTRRRISEVFWSNLMAGTIQALIVTGFPATTSSFRHRHPRFLSIDRKFHSISLTFPSLICSRRHSQFIPVRACQSSDQVRSCSATLGSLRLCNQSPLERTMLLAQLLVHNSRLFTIKNHGYIWVWEEEWKLGHVNWGMSVVVQSCDLWLHSYQSLNGWLFLAVALQPIKYR